MVLEAQLHGISIVWASWKFGNVAACFEHQLKARLTRCSVVAIAVEKRLARDNLGVYVELKAACSLPNSVVVILVCSRLELLFSKPRQAHATADILLNA